jgi:hypothetical protein
MLLLSLRAIEHGMIGQVSSRSAGLKWRTCLGLELHDLYRAMAWLGGAVSIYRRPWQSTIISVHDQKLLCFYANQR